MSKVSQIITETVLKRMEEAEKNGEVFIFKNNKPRFRLIDVEQCAAIEMTDDEKSCFTIRTPRLCGVALKILAH